MPGAPTIYYGDEAGLCGFTDPDNRRSYPWGREDLELLGFHKEIIRIHRENKVLTFGSILLLAAEQNMVSYARFDRKQQMVIALNNREEEAVMDISVWETGIPIECEMERLMLTTRDGHTTEPETYRVREGRMELKLPPFSAVILRRR